MRVPVYFTDPVQGMFELWKAQPNFVEITTPATAGQELEVRHDLGRIPIGCAVVKGDPGGSGLRNQQTLLIDITPEDLFPIAAGVYTACSARAHIATTWLQGLLCANGSDQGMAGLAFIPNEYNSGTLTMTVYWVTSSASTNPCALGVLYGAAPSGTNITLATMSLADPDVTHITSANQGAYLVNQASFTAATPTNAGAGRPLVFFIGRPSTLDADDTLAADIYIIGAKLELTKSSLNLGDTTTWTDTSAYLKFEATSRALTLAFF